jgi:flagellar M-ring protein FliF
MANPIEPYLKALTQRWQALSANQKVGAMLGGVIIVIVMSGSFYWASRPDFTVLYTNLTAQDANAVVEYLRESKIPYQLSSGGTQVEVPSKNMYEVRLALAGKGVPRGNGAGYEIFDKMSFGMTDEVQKINYLRAMQSELEKTIDSLDVIEKSRVHLVMAQDDLWIEGSFAPTASVMVKLATGGKLQPQQVESIRYLLASAVRGLVPERVTIVDTMGNVLSTAGDAETAGGLSNRQIEYRKKLEENLKGQAESLLTEILGPGKSAVRVHAEVDFDQVVSEREYYTPVSGSKGLLRSERQNSVTPVDASVAAGGVPGTASNLQGYPPSNQFQHNTGSSKSERVANYEVNRTVEHMTNATGTVKKLSVGVFLDGKIPPAQLGDIQSVLSRALGIDPARGDLIEVKAIPFNRQALQDDRVLLEKSERQKFWLNMLTHWLPRGLLLAGAAALLFFGLKNLQQLSVKISQAAENGKKNGNGKMDSETILALIKQNPAETAQVLKQWIS